MGHFVIYGLFRKDVANEERLNSFSCDYEKLAKDYEFAVANLKEDGITWQIKTLEMSDHYVYDESDFVSDTEDNSD